MQLVKSPRRLKRALSLFSLSILLTAACSKSLYLQNSEVQLYKLTKESPKDSALVNYLRPYKSSLDSQMQQVIAFAEKDIERGRPEGALNNLMADAMYEVAKQKQIDFDVAYTNYGGLRLPISKGDIKLSTVFELMPFENLLTTVTFSGADFQQFFDYIASMGGDPIAGATFVIKDKKAVDIRINGKPLDPNHDYTVLTSDYMANGGDGAEIFFQAKTRKAHDVKLRDALILYLEQQAAAGKTINPKIDGRITVQ